MLAAGRVKRGSGGNPEQTPPELREPLATLGLSWPTTLEAVKMRYKELAKRHHPDANGGDRAAEERLKTINLAYAAVRSRLVAAPSVAAVGMTRAGSRTCVCLAPGLHFQGLTQDILADEQRCLPG